MLGIPISVPSVGLNITTLKGTGSKLTVRLMSLKGEFKGIVGI